MTFSIIIPAYNSAAYIHKALDSIARQTFHDYEVIVVCDSCKDETAEVARGYGAKVLTVPFENEGLTRNVGIDVSAGDWLLFMDDDDWFTRDDVLQTIYNALDDDIDVIRFGFIWGKLGYHKPGNYYACWNKCYRRAFVGSTRFTSEKNRADVGFRNYILDKNPRTRDINDALYYYDYMREGSVSWARGC